MDSLLSLSSQLPCQDVIHPGGHTQHGTKIASEPPPGLLGGLGLSFSCSTAVPPALSGLGALRSVSYDGRMLVGPPGGLQAPCRQGLCPAHNYVLGPWPVAGTCSRVLGKHWTKDGWW